MIFLLLRTKLSILIGYLELKFEVFITFDLHTFCFKFGFKWVNEQAEQQSR